MDKAEKLSSTIGVTGRDSVKVPVLVFIHGESYEWNAGNPYDGSVLASYGKVVVVTVNFRLGVLGFLPVIEGSARGNYGITDQVAALHWIQENIAEFGGDPQNVTLFGQGHGAALVNFLVLSPMAKGSSLFPAGLFHRAIMMSGSALSPWAIARDANFYAQQIARTLGCPTNHPANLLECLRQRSVSDILRVQITVPMFLTGFGPTIDGIVIQNEPSVMMEELASEHPYGLFDLMFGVTKVASYFQVSQQEERDGLGIERRDKLLRTLVRNIFNYHLQEIFLTIVNEYTDWSKNSQHDLNILDGTLDALGDALVVAPIIKSANYHPSSGERKAYFYVFNYQTEDSKYPQRQGCLPGEDLQYVFGAPLVKNLGHFSKNYSEPETVLSEAVMTYWVNFARNGDPNTVQPDKPGDKSKSRYDRMTWQPYDKVHQRYMMLGLKPKVRDHYHAHRLSFWLNLFPQLHQTSSVKVNPEHHLLDDHDNPNSYEGPVRQVPSSLSKLSADAATPSNTLTSTEDSNEDGSKKDDILTSENSNLQSSTEDSTQPTTTVNATDSLAVVMPVSNFSAALSVTLVSGASLFLLNVLIFVGIHYQRGKSRAEIASNKRNSSQTSLEEPQANLPTVAHVKTVSLRAPPPSPVCQTEELTLHPPPHHHHPHKAPLKPCAVPTPPKLLHRESLAEMQPIIHLQGAHAASLANKSPVHQNSQNTAQVHLPCNHEIKL
nr:neuroligin-4, X-linked [Parasteatoda tepidariorum]